MQNAMQDDFLSLRLSGDKQKQYNELDQLNACIAVCSLSLVDNQYIYADI